MADRINAYPNKKGPRIIAVGTIGAYLESATNDDGVLQGMRVGLKFLSILAINLRWLMLVTNFQFASIYIVNAD